jgi:beta-phosphoglucomutase
VLIDSYHAHYESWKRALAEHGRTMTEAQFDATFGRTSREVIAALWPEAGSKEGEIEAIDRRKEALFRQILDEAFPAMPGADELLASLHDAGFALGVGSSGPPENVFSVLDRMNARRYFHAVVTGADVTRGKPDPQVFERAAQRMELPPGRCAVVEDAPLGIEAANAAGMKGIGLVSTGRTREMLAAADLVVTSLRDLSPEAISKLIAGGRPLGGAESTSRDR